MSARSIRRAAERQHQKLERKAAAQQAETSEARVAANRANAQLSTGPTSPEGKATSSLNAVKTGDEPAVLSAAKIQARFGRTVLLPSDDAAAYEHHVAAFFAEWQPATDAESALVQSLADTGWRLLRIPFLEAGIYALGRIEFAKLFDDHDFFLRPALIEAHTYLAYHRQLNNLSIQESRLRRQLIKDTADLRQLQSDRRARETAKPPVQTAALTIHPDALGFKFSTDETALAATTAQGFPTSNFHHTQPISEV